MNIDVYIQVFKEHCNNLDHEEMDGIAEWLKELKFLRTTKETMYREIYGKGRADAINPIQKFIDDYDGAIIVSENMGVINGQQLINELKEIVEQLKEQKND